MATSLVTTVATAPPGNGKKELTNTFTRVLAPTLTLFSSVLPSSFIKVSVTCAVAVEKFASSSHIWYGGEVAPSAKYHASAGALTPCEACPSSPMYMARSALNGLADSAFMASAAFGTSRLTSTLRRLVAPTLYVLTTGAPLCLK